MIISKSKINCCSMLIIALLHIFVCLPAAANDKASRIPFPATNVYRPDNTVSEYTYQNETNALLMEVNVLGAVKKPGIYRIPVNTNLFTLITIAGGYTEDAKRDEILIRNLQDGNRNQKVNMITLLNNDTGFQPPLIYPNDAVYVDAHQRFLQQDVVSTVSVISGILGIILTSILISRSK